jgi:drug/metabolite transporter (DMT)-like permease
VTRQPAEGDPSEVAQAFDQALSRQRLRKPLGWLAVFCSAFFFYLATAIISWAHQEVEIASAYFTFARFCLGFLVVSATMAWRRLPPSPRNHHLLLGRTIANTVSVFCFYRAVDLSTVAQANILNMTYPLFLALFSWFVLRAQRDRLALFFVLVAVAGVWLILSPGGSPLTGNSLWGLASGFMGAIAMLYLNLSRQHHDSHTILFYMFGLGSVFMAVLFHRALFIPDPRELFYLVTCSAAGVAGQYLLTFGFRYVTAVEGSVIGSTRILLAAILGPILVADPPLDLAGWFGALLIFTANIALTMRRVQQLHRSQRPGRP